MRFLVTGGAGFIGSNIAETLIAHGHFVRVLDNFSSGSKENLRFAIGLKRINSNLAREISVIRRPATRPAGTLIMYCIRRHYALCPNP